MPLKTLRSNPDKLQSITPALQALLAKNEQLREWAQRALVAYLRSVFLQPNKDVFDVLTVDVEGLATSMGLPSVPKLRFLQRERYRKAAKGGGAQDTRATRAEDDDEDSDVDHGVDRHRASQRAPSRDAVEQPGHPGQSYFDVGMEDNDDEDDDLLVVKRRDVHGALTADDAPLPPKAPKRLKIKANGGGGQRVVFDEEGNRVDPLQALAQSMQVGIRPYLKGAWARNVANAANINAANINAVNINANNINANTMCPTNMCPTNMYANTMNANTMNEVPVGYNRQCRHASHFCMHMQHIAPAQLERHSFVPTGQWSDAGRRLGRG